MKIEKISYYYQILELKPGASADEIRRAYKDLTKVWHPDRFASDQHLQQKANEKLKEINLAYQELMKCTASPNAQSFDPQMRKKVRGSDLNIDI